MSVLRANYARRLPDGEPPTSTMNVEIYRMATDYDAPRKSEDDSESIEALKERVPDKLSGTTGDEDSDNPSSFDLPGADLSDLELDVVVLPAQQDEFTCMSCFLVKHRSQLDHEGADGLICKECAA
jgi:hypothetical protein